jgi:hypothetical protein
LMICKVWVGPTGRIEFGRQILLDSHDKVTNIQTTRGWHLIAWQPSSKR